MGYVPSFFVAFVMIFITMICWGSWTNTMNKTGKWRFEAYFIDFVVGLFLTLLIISVTLGGMSSGGWSLANILQNFNGATSLSYLWAIFAGVVLGIGNMLFMVAVTLAGMAVGFPLALGVTLTLGTALAYITKPEATHNPLFLFVGLGFVILAILANARAYQIKEWGMKRSEYFKSGIIVSILCGAVLALYGFPLNFAFAAGLTSYSVSFLAGVGFLISAAVTLLILLKKSLLPNQPPVKIEEYLKARLSWHVWAMLGGVIWAVGTSFNFIVANSPSFSVAIVFALGECSTLIGALWGIFVWKEFKGTSKKTYIYLAVMFLLFVAGIVSIASATG